MRAQEALSVWEIVELQRRCLEAKVLALETSSPMNPGHGSLRVNRQRIVPPYRQKAFCMPIHTQRQRATVRLPSPASRARTIAS